jgi:hypothetical protein
MREQAIYNLYPNVTSTIGNGAFDNGGNPVSLDESAIASEVEKLQAEYDANQFQRDRTYPSIGDQLDMQYHDQLDGTTTWKDAIAKVKSDNPKPE